MSPPAGTARRLYAPVVLATLAVGGIAFLAASRPWIHATVRADGLPSDAVAVSGSDAQPLVPALALVVVTSALAMLAASHRIRRAVGALLVIVGLGAAVLVAMSGTALDDTLADAVRSSTAFIGSNAPQGDRSLIWPVVAGGAFVAAAAFGLVAARFGGEWPTMGSRYDSPVARTDTPRSDADLWAAMDEGRDPTE